MLCVVRQRSLRRADNSSGGVLPTVVRPCVLSKNLKNEEAMTRVGSQRHGKKIIITIMAFEVKSNKHSMYRMCK